jgi:hypothetical protein
MTVSACHVVAFPRQIRVTRVEAPVQPAGDVIDHDGRAYDFAALVQNLPAEVAQGVMDQAPRSAQAFWDVLVRLFPREAAGCVARLADR